MRRAAIATIVLAAVFPTAAGAAGQRLDGVLTLDQAVHRVQQVGFDVRMAQGDAEIAAADARSARAGLLPQISVSGVGLNADEPQLGMPVARQAYGAASLSVPIFTPSTRNSARAASTAAAAASNSVIATATDAVFVVTQAYRRAQLGDVVVSARQEAVRNQRDHLRLSELRVAAGKSPRYILARDRASLAVALQNLEDAASERDQARNDLAALLDLSVDSRITTEPLIAVAFPETREAVLARAVLRRPALIAAEQRVTAAHSSVAAARDASLPTAQVTAQTYNGASSPNLGAAGSQVQVTVTLPIVDGGTRSAASARAHGELDRAVAARDQLRVAVERDVADAYREFEAARANLATAQAAQTDAQEQLRIARDRERAGKGIELEVLDALSVASGARETVLRSLSRYDDAVAAIHHAAGDRTP